MKTCPFCAENIKKEAIKCKYCGEFLSEKNEANVSQEDSIVISLRSWFMHIDFVKEIRKINKLFTQRDYLDVVVTKNRIVFIYGADPKGQSYDLQDVQGLIPFLLVAAVNKYRHRKVERISYSDVKHCIECGNAIYCNIDNTECIIENIKGSLLDGDYSMLGRQTFFCRVTFSGKFYYLNHVFTGTIAGIYNTKPKSTQKEFKEYCPNLTFRLPEEKLDNEFKTYINEEFAKMNSDERFKYYRDEDYFNP